MSTPNGAASKHGWSIQIRYTTRDDRGQRFTAHSGFFSEKEEMRDAYEEAKKLDLEDLKLGACIPGRHSMAGS